MSRALLLSVACSTTLMGCILRDFDYPDPVPVPPSVLGSTEDPLDRVQELDLDLVIGGGDGGVGADLDFVAIVRDPDLDEPLQGLVFVDRSATDPRPIGPEFPIPVEQDEDPLHRRVRFTVPRARFAPAGCHRVELHVSGGFVDFSNPRPAIDGDLGVGVWWVVATDAGNLEPPMTGCDSVTAE